MYWRVSMFALFRLSNRRRPALLLHVPSLFSREGAQEMLGKSGYSSSSRRFMQLQHQLQQQQQQQQQQQ